VDVELIKLFDGVMDRDTSDQVNARFLFQFCNAAVIKLSGAPDVGVD
jgi:hypothetical protein